MRLYESNDQFVSAVRKQDGSLGRWLSEAIPSDTARIVVTIEVELTDRAPLFCKIKLDRTSPSYAASALNVASGSGRCNG